MAKETPGNRTEESVALQEEDRRNEENGLYDSDAFLGKLFHKHVASSIVSMFGVQSCMMVNSVLAGKFFATDGLAVMSVAAPFYALFAAVGALTGVGGATLASHMLGQDDTEKANGAFTLSVALSGGFSLAIALLCAAFLEPLLCLFGASPQIYPMAYDYSLVYILGGIGTAMFYLPYNFLKLAGKLRLLTSMFLGMAAANLALDIFFVRCCGMGMDGIAWGTILSSIGASLLGLKFLSRGESPFRIVRSLEPKSMRHLIALGTPSALNQALNFLRLLLMNRIIVAAAGDVGLAAFSVFSALEKLSLVALSGLAQATIPFVGVFSKEMDTVSVRRIEKMAHAIGMALVLPMMAAILCFPEEICRFFGIYDPEKLQVASDAAYLFAFSLPPSVTCFLLFFYYQAIGFTRLANVLVFCRSFLFLVLPAYLLAPAIGLNAVWESMTIASFSPLALMLFLMPWYAKKGYSGFFLQNLQAEENGTYIFFAVKADVNAIIEAADKIAVFCKRNGLTGKETMLVRLSMEEMLLSINDHCFPPGSGETIDARILVARHGDDVIIILRLRNGGTLFNPIAYYEQQVDADPDRMGDSLGIEMIAKAADAIHYKSTFGVNNLTVIIDRKA